MKKIDLERSACKKTLAAILAFTMALGAAACGAKETEETKKKKKKATEKTESVEHVFAKSMTIPDESETETEPDASIPFPSTDTSTTSSDETDPFLPTDETSPTETLDIDYEEDLGDPIDSPDTEVPKTAEGFVMENEVIVDNDMYRVTFLSIVPHEYAEGFVIYVKCENKTPDKTLWFEINDTVVNGYEAGSTLIEKIGPQRKTISRLRITGEIFDMGILKTIDQLSFVLEISEAGQSSLEDLLEQTFTVYPTGLTAEQIVIPERPTFPGEDVLVDNDQITVIIYSSGMNDFGDFDLNMYIENKTDAPLRCELQGVLVNGRPADPYWVYRAPAHAKAFTSMRLYEMTMQEMKVTKVEKIDFALCVRERGKNENLFLAPHEYKPQ